MSTTEAELVALAACAIELIYIMQLLKFIGYECDETVCGDRQQGSYAAPSCRRGGQHFACSGMGFTPCRGVRERKVPIVCFPTCLLVMSKPHSLSLIHI